MLFTVSELDKQLFVSVLLDGKETALEFLTPSENLVSSPAICVCVWGGGGGALVS